MSDPRPLSSRTLAAQAMGTVDERTRAKTSINELLRD